MKALTSKDGLWFSSSYDQVLTIFTPSKMIKRVKHPLPDVAEIAILKLSKDEVTLILTGKGVCILKIAI